MATDVSIRVGVDGEKEFRSALSGINSQIKNLNSEMKTIVTSMNGMDNAEEKVAQQTNVLGRAMDATKQKITTLTAQYDRQKAKLAQLGTELDQLQNAQNKDEKAITRATNAYNQQQKIVNDLGTQLNNATSDMNRMEREMLDLVSSADSMGDALDDAGSQAADFGDVLKANLLSNAISNGIHALGEGLKSAFSMGLGYNSTIETYTTSFEVMTGSAEKAAETVEELARIAAETPFEMPDLANVTQLLMNYGFTADEAIDRMMMLGDISQGSAEKMQSIATAYGQMSSAGKVQLEDIKQMIENGFNPLQEISESTGESMASLYDRISDGTVTVDEITRSMQRATSEGGRYFQSMEKQSETFSGQLSTLQDNINSALGDTFSGITTELSRTVLPKLNSALESIDFSVIGDKIGTAFSWLLQNGDTIVSVIGKVAAGLAGVATVAGTVKLYNIATDLGGVVTAATSGAQALATYTTATKAATVAQAALSAAMSITPLGAVALGLGAVVAGMTVYVNATNDAKTESELMGESLDELTQKSYEYQTAQQGIADRREEQLASSESELVYAQQMIAQLDALTDANGRVTAGEEARAQTLANMINEIIPGAIEWTYQQGEAYANLASNLDTLIQKERLNALIQANQEGYQTAIQNQQSYLDSMVQSAQAVDQLSTELETLRSQIESGNYTEATELQFGEVSRQLSQAQEELTKYKDLYVDSSETIMQQENLMAAAASNDYATMQAAIEQYGGALQTFTGSNQAELAQQAADMQAAYETMLALSQEYPGLITDAQLAEAQSRAEQAKTIAEQAGLEEAQAQAAGMTSGQSDIQSAGEANAQSGAQGANSQTSQFTTAGTNAGAGYVNGIRSKGSDAYSAGAYLGNQAAAGLNSAQQSYSPSRVTMKSGEWFDQGYERGIKKGISPVLQAVTSMATGALDILSHGGNDAETLAVKTSRSLGKLLEKEQSKLNDQLAELDQKERDRQAAEELADYKEKIQKKYDELAEAEISERQKIQDEISRMEEEWRDEQLREQLESQIDALEEFTDAYEDALSEIEDAQESMADKLKDYGELFETVKTETSEYLELGDLEDDIDTINRYGEALQNLQLRGVSDSLMDEILGMDVDDAIAYTDKLLAMTDEQYSEYMTLWQQKQEAAQKIAKQFYASELDALESEFISKIPSELDGVKSEFEDVGVQSVQVLIAGMLSQTGALFAAARSLISDALGQMQDEAGIHSPSRVAANMVGAPLAEGVEMGFLDKIDSAARNIASVMQSRNGIISRMATPAYAGATGGAMTVAPIQVNVPVDMSIDGAVFARKTYTAYVREGNLRGQSAVRSSRNGG